MQTPQSTYIILEEIIKLQTHKLSLVTRKEDNQKYIIKNLNLTFIDSSEINEVKMYITFPKYENLIHCYEIIKSQSEYNYSLVLDPINNSKTLKSLISETTYLPEPIIWSYLLQMLYSIYPLHSNGIIHRNINNSNFYLFNNDSLIKLGGFKLCEIKGFKRISNYNYKEKIKKNNYLFNGFNGAMRGNLSSNSSINYLYAAPELVNKDEYSFNSDIFSIGVCIYELCFSKGDYNSIEMYINLINGKMKDLNGNIYSNELLDVVHLMLEVNRIKRPTVEDLLGNKIIKKHIYNPIKYIDVLSCGNGWINDIPDINAFEELDKYIDSQTKGKIISFDNEYDNNNYNTCSNTSCNNKSSVGSSGKFVKIFKHKNSSNKYHKLKVVYNHNRSRSKKINNTNNIANYKAINTERDDTLSNNNVENNKKFYGSCGDEYKNIYDELSLNLDNNDNINANKDKKINNVLLNSLLINNNNNKKSPITKKRNINSINKDNNNTEFSKMMSKSNSNNNIISIKDEYSKLIKKNTEYKINKMTKNSKFKESNYIESNIESSKFNKKTDEDNSFMNKVNRINKANKNSLNNRKNSVEKSSNLNSKSLSKFKNCNNNGKIYVNDKNLNTNNGEKCLKDYDFLNEMFDSKNIKLKEDNNNRIGTNNSNSYNNTINFNSNTNIKNINSNTSIKSGRVVNSNVYNNIKKHKSKNNMCNKTNKSNSNTNNSKKINKENLI